MTKMTEEELELFHRIASGEDMSWDDRMRHWMKRGSRHIAALEAELADARRFHTAEHRDRVAAEAERDEWKAEAEHKQAALTGVSRDLDEAVAARERAEADNAALILFLRQAAEDLEDAGCPAHAINPRAAADGEHPGAALLERLRALERVTDEVKADAAPVPQTDDLTAIEQWRENQEATAEPSTAEAFAEIRATFDLTGADDGEEVGDVEERVAHLLSLLERRMGAQRDALEGLLAFVAEHPDFTDPKEADAYAAVEHARAALTDAPDVFTREEVEEALAAQGLSDEADAEIWARLAALRREA